MVQIVCQTWAHESLEVFFFGFVASFFLIIVLCESVWNFGFIMPGVHYYNKYHMKKVTWCTIHGGYSTRSITA
jgi:hypothetical protein